MGAVWNLALAIHEATGLSIEVFMGLAGTPRHVYAVDGEMALDVRGRNPLRFVRLGATEHRQMTPDELFDYIGDADADRPSAGGADPR